MSDKIQDQGKEGHGQTTSMYDDWSVSNHLTNIKLVLETFRDKQEIYLLDLANAITQIDHIRRKLGLPEDTN